MDRLKDVGAVKVVFQKEKGESGTPHFQGAVQWKTTREIVALVKKLPGIHWEVMRGSWQEAQDYCDDPSKDVLEPPLYFECSPRKRLQFRIQPFMRSEWQAGLWDLVHGPAPFREIHWYWEATGNVGKTSIAHDIIVDFMMRKEVALLVSGKAADIKSAIATSMAEKGSKVGKVPKVLIWDLPRTRQSYIDYAGLEEVKNGIFFSGKYESGMILMPESPHVIVFANFPPEREKLSGDRWVVHDLNPEGFVPGPSVPLDRSPIRWEDAV